jgi:hypothetical protein
VDPVPGQHNQLSLHRIRLEALTCALPAEIGNTESHTPKLVLSRRSLALCGLREIFSCGL